MDEINSQEENKPHRFAKYRKKRFLIFICCLVVVAGFGGPEIFKYLKGLVLAQNGIYINESLDGNSLLYIRKNINIPILLPYVPNFEKLTEEDLPLPNGSLITHKNHSFLWSGSQILEIDSKTHKYIREGEMPCSSIQGMLIQGTTLFVKCWNTQQLSTITQLVSDIFTIDLNSGFMKNYYDQGIDDVDTTDVINKKMIETYSDKSLTGLYDNLKDFPYFSNINFTVKDDNLWLGVRNGVVRIDTKSDNTVFYNLNAFSCKSTCLDYKLGFEPSATFPIYSNNSAVWTYTLTPEKKIILYIYNNKKKGWDSYSSENIEKSEINNLYSILWGSNTIYFSYFTPVKGNTNSFNSNSTRFIEFNTLTRKWKYITDTKNTDKAQKKYFPNAVHRVGEFYVQYGPYYEAISNKINDKYYLETADGIYVLNKNSFPKKILDIDLSAISVSAIFVDKDEKNIIIMGRKEDPRGPVVTLGEELTILKIDLKSKKLIDIMKNSTASGEKISFSYPTDTLQAVVNLFDFTPNTLRLRPTKDGFIIASELGSHGDSDVREIGEVNLQNNTFQLFYSCFGQRTPALMDCLPKE